MRKQYLAIAKRAGKAVLCAALAVAMVVPANLPDIGVSSVVSDEVVEAEAAELPNPVMTLDFERGFLGEQEENELAVVKSEELLQFKELTDDSGNYTKDADGNYIYELTDIPFIEAGDYKYGVDGNQPTTYFDSERGNTLMLDSSKKIEEYVKKYSDELDDKYPLGTVLQEETTTYSAVSIKNPFANDENLTGQEGTVTDAGTNPAKTWPETYGVSISYWVKAGVNARTEEQEADNIIKNDSILFTFQNDSKDYVYEVNDLMKYEACVAYTECVTNNKGTYTGEYSGTEYTASDFDLGTTKTVTLYDTKGGTGTATDYTVIENYGKLVRANPSYNPNKEKIYFVNKYSGDVDGYESGATSKTRLTEIGECIWEEYHTLDPAEGSKVKFGQISGSLTIAASNSFAFKEDDYTVETVKDENGTEISTVIQSAVQLNPNATDYSVDENGNPNYSLQLRHYNDLYFQGDGTVCAEDENNETSWHYVTCVIQNDAVVFYVDGEQYNADKGEWMYSPSNLTEFNSMNAGKYFNGGYGYRDPYSKGTPKTWSTNGTMDDNPGNTCARTIMEWLSDEDTVLMIGGQGSANIGLESQEIGNGDGTLLDDIAFYDVALTEEQAVALYEKASAEKSAEPAAELLKQYNFDEDELYAQPADMEAAASNASDTNPMVVNDGTRGHVLAVLGGKTTATSSTVFDNPYAGNDDITGVTVSYWYKGVLNNKKQVNDSIGLSFNDDPKIIEHDKIQESSKESETRTGLWIKTSLDTTFEAGYDTKVYESLKDKYVTSSRYGVFYNATADGYMEESGAAQTEWQNRLNSFTDWHYVTMVATDAEIVLYYDGERLPNNLIDDKKEPAFYGPRFYDGYYTRVLDGFAKYKLASNNQTAPGVMSFLTQEDTKVYIGLAYVYGSNKTYQGTAQGLYDDISFYDAAMTDEQVAALYKDAAAKSVSAVSGEEVWSFDGAATATETPSDDEPQNPDTSIKDVTAGTQNADGSTTFNSTATGVKVTAPAGALPDGAELVVTILGTSSDADRYTNADTVLAGISGLSVGSRLLYDIHFEKDGAVVQPTAAVTVELTPYTGYTASKCKIVYIDGKALVSTTVSGSNLVFSTQNLGEFALVQEASSSDSGSSDSNVSGNAGSSTNNTSKSSTSGSTSASKTADVANVMLPLLLLAAAVAAILIARKRRVTES